MNAAGVVEAPSAQSATTLQETICTRAMDAPAALRNPHTTLEERFTAFTQLQVQMQVQMQAQIGAISTRVSALEQGSCWGQSIRSDPEGLTEGRAELDQLQHRVAKLEGLLDGLETQLLAVQLRSETLVAKTREVMDKELGTIMRSVREQADEESLQRRGEDRLRESDEASRTLGVVLILCGREGLQQSVSRSCSCNTS